MRLASRAARCSALPSSPWPLRQPAKTMDPNTRTVRIARLFFMRDLDWFEPTGLLKALSRAAPRGLGLRGQGRGAAVALVLRGDRLGFHEVLSEHVDEPPGGREPVLGHEDDERCE